MCDAWVGPQQLASGFAVAGFPPARTPAVLGILPD